MASYIGQVKIGTGDAAPVGSMLYGTCTTEASTAAKVATLAAFDTLGTGVTVHIKFTNSNTASSPTLKVGSTDAKAIKKYGTTDVGNTVAASWVAGAIVSFTYDGTNWVMNTGIDTDTTDFAATAAPDAIAASGAQGSSTNYARQDHTHAIVVGEGTSNGQIKIAGQDASVKGWSSKANLASPALTGTPTAPTANAGTNSTQIATTAFVATAISNSFAANDAMVFKGTLGTGGTITTVPTNNYSAGATYKIITAGTYANIKCEVGDMLIAINDGPASGSSVINADWTVVQTNIDGAVTGPASATDGNIVLFNGTTGKIIKNSSYSPSSFASSGHTQAVNKGGTNITAYTAGDLLYASGETTLSKLNIGSANKILASTGSAPAWKTASVSVTANNSGSVVTGVGALTGGVLPTFTQGTKAKAEVSNGTLTITNQGEDTFTKGTLPSLGTVSKANLGVSLS